MNGSALGNQASTRHSTTRRLSLGVLVGYAAGQFGAQICRDVPSSLLLFFMTQALGVPPVLAGAAVLLPKLWVICADLVVGVASDRTVSRWGRRRPYLFVGAWVAVGGFVATFDAPRVQSALTTAIYVGAGYLVLCTGLSLYGVPHLALASELSEEPNERTRLLSMRQIFVLAAVLAGFVGAPYIISTHGGGLHGYRLMAAILGPAMLLTMLLPVISIREGTRLVPGRRNPLLMELRSLVGRGSFTVLIGANFVQGIAAGASSSAAAYYITQALGFDLTTFARYALCSVAGAALSQPLWVALARRFDRPSVYPAALALHIVSLLASYLLPAQQLALLLLVGVMTGIANAGFSLLSASILTDIIQCDARATGGRAAFLSSIFTMTEKVALALGAFVVAGVLGANGFIESRGVVVHQTAQAIDATRFAYAIVTMGFQGVALLIALYLRRRLAAEAATILQPPIGDT